MTQQDKRRATPASGRSDRRVLRTQKRLREALHSLIHERDYDSIAVKEILDRADVGRSAFYMHFRDKDELLVSALHEILGVVPASRPSTRASRDERLLWFSLPVFEHLYRLRDAGELKLGPKGRAVLHGYLGKVLATLIEEDVRRMFRGRRRVTHQIPMNLLVRYIPSTFILVLNWWVENKCPLPPAEIDEVFRSLILPTLRDICARD